MAFIWLPGQSWAQGYSNESWFVESGILAGRSIPNFSRFPDAGIRQGYLIGVGKKHQSDSIHWHRYYNYPSLSLAFLYSDLGSAELGKELSLIPYFVINFSKKKQKSFYARFGLGLSYATNPWDSLTNRNNEILGDHWNWIFHAALERTLVHTSRFQLRLGAAYLHSSNSHTNLPNFGLNSVMLSLTAQYYQYPVLPVSGNLHNLEPDRNRIFFLQIMPGFGVHELGGTRRPRNGPNKYIPSLSVQGGVIFRQHLKVKLGLTYRYYDSFRDDIVANELSDYQDAPVWNATHIFLGVGVEYLVGHVGLDLESGFTIHKPYFDHWYERFASDKTEWDRWRNKNIPRRIGLNLYLLNTNKNPRQNVFVGLHINANWATADFMGYTVGYVKRWE